MRVCTCEGRQSIVACGNDLVGVHDESYEGNKVVRCYKLYIQDNPYPTAFPYGNGMVLHFYQQQESSTTKTVHKVINKGLKAYV